MIFRDFSFFRFGGGRIWNLEKKLERIDEF